MRWRRSRARREALACQELVELVTDFLEGALTPDLHRAFTDHISGCGNCSEYLRQMRRTIEWEREVGRPPDPQTDPADEGMAKLLDVLLPEFRAHHPR